jgi:hypothetical protein
MSPLAQIVVAAVTAGLPTLTVLVSLLINNQRLTEFEKRVDQRFVDLEKRMDHRFVDMEQRLIDMRDLLRAEFFRVEQVMDARLKHLEESSQH